MNAVIQNLTSQAQFHQGPIRKAQGATLPTLVAAVVLRWIERARQRRHLSELTERELDDVGINLEAALVEAAKPFWQA